MRKFFTTGLGILLPIIITILLIGFLVNILTKPFLSLTEGFLVQHNLVLQPTLLIITSKILILVILAIILLIIGLIGNAFLINYIFRLNDYLFHRVPVINKIYKACQDVVHSLFSSSSSSFSQVVLVPFPCSDTLSVGLITKDSFIINTGSGGDEVVPVYIPGTPNPTVGFMLMFRKNQLIYSTMKAEEAMKFVVSCGIAMPEFRTSNSPEIKDEK